MSLSLGTRLAEHGAVPTPLVRYGIRRLLARRLADQRRTNGVEALIDELRRGPIALQPEAANEQHYEVPSRFYELVLGPHLKYSSALWSDDVPTLGDAEEAMLALYCERADLQDGQDILELGCGWGSLSLYIARRHPKSRILAVSNSAQQRAFIERRKPDNLEVVTADMNDFATDRRFNRVVSIEMFEHMRNYEVLMKRIAGWLRPDGTVFVHIFCHRDHAYPFETDGASNWMGRYFFTAGLMPSLDLLRAFGEDLRLEQRWEVSGTHYERTAAAWRQNLESHRGAVIDVLREQHGRDARRWYHRWRLFFLACEELFGHRGGTEWMVGHYRFAHRHDRLTDGVPGSEPVESSHVPRTRV